MALSDLSDPTAVFSAIDECDRLGRDEFLSRYGFGEARTYFLEYDGKRYDSKAIVGVAHKYQMGKALKALEFSGGDRTVAAKLNELGFIVTRPSAGWRIPIGRVLTKADIHSEYGGSIYGGIAPSTSTPNIMIYSDPAVGEQHGYQFDGWSEGEKGVFAYTGEGQIGDQTLTGNNRSLRDHAREGRVIRLFFTVPGSDQPGGKLRRYVGAFRVDPEAPLEWRHAPDNEGNNRKVVVFRLLPDEVDDYPLDPVEQPQVSIGHKKASKPERETQVCGEHFLELSITGKCALCDD